MRGLFTRLWLACGSVDALYASALTLARGDGDIAAMWRGVASGPFGDSATQWGIAGTFAGIAVHFAIMAVMVGIGLRLARHGVSEQTPAWKAGTLFGLVAYGVMYGLVLQSRFGTPFPNPDKIKLALALFPHVFLVGIPIFHFARREMNTSPAS